jgi:hypothetical protein
MFKENSLIKYFKEIDENVVKKCCIFYGNNFYKHFLLAFEYIFHGVPWFLLVAIGYFCNDESISKKSFILFIGIYFILFFYNTSLMNS